MFSKLEKFNVCFEENVTEFENVSLACLNLQKEIFKVKSEKEHYINQFLQFHAELLRVHSMWQDLKIELENKMFEFEDTSPSCSTTQYLSSDIDRLSSALDELLNQLEASRQNIDQSEYSAIASEELAKGTFSAELEESEQRRHKFLDSEDNQYDDSEEQDLNDSFRRIVTDSAEEKIFAVRENVSQEFEEDMTVPESPSSSGDESFEKVNERIKFVCKREEKLYQSVNPKDRFSEEPEYDKHRLYMIWEEEYEVSDTTESEPEQISALEDELAEQRCYTQQTQGSEMLCVPDEVVMKPLLEKQKVYHLEAELSNERVEKDYYKKLYNESQNVVLQLHAAVDKYNLHHIEKSAEPETSSSSRNDDDDDDDDDDESAEDSIKGVWKSVAKLDFQVQTIKQLVEKFRNVPDPKEVLSTKDSSLQNDLRDTFDAPQPAQLETTAPESDQELMTKLVLLQQRICDLEAQLSKEKDQKNHYNKLYHELEVELLKMHTALDKMNHKYEDRTALDRDLNRAQIVD
ncbi:FK506-binding protein 5-like [Gambusia affinis]|uniref:FK506-binding protein 5-like n=1 Tax=Gambusia affinis TaxID=33528 RepID=UPI001CDCC228|nr:FK506-binding protein 5-like [Gambusia affinis]